MKMLLSRQITRATKDGLGDYEPAADQATDDGRRAFEGRQEARRLAAQGQPKPEPSNVTAILPIVRKRKP